MCLLVKSSQTQKSNGLKTDMSEQYSKIMSYLKMQNSQKWKIHPHCCFFPCFFHPFLDTSHTFPLTQPHDPQPHKTSPTMARSLPCIFNPSSRRRCAALVAASGLGAKSKCRSSRISATRTDEPLEVVTHRNTF